MHVGVCRLTLHFPEGQSLKEKRRVVRSLSSQVRNRFNVAVAEVDDQSLWQRLTLGITCVSNDARHAQEMMDRVLNFLEGARGDLVLLDVTTEVISGWSETDTP